MKLNLRESDLLGVGNERLCFVHPDVEERCVKVNKPGVVHRSQNKIEKYYFEKLKKKEKFHSIIFLNTMEMLILIMVLVWSLKE